MRKTDLCSARQKLLVQLPEYPGAFALVPPPTPREIPLRGIGNEINRAHEALGALQALTARLPKPDIVTRTLDRREAVRSSQIEGTHSDVNDLFVYEATGSDVGMPPDVLVTSNYLSALDFGLKKIRRIGSVKALTNELIKELHFCLMDGAKEFSGKAGKFRDKQNWIGGFRIYQARFVPPPADQIQDCMNDLQSRLQYRPREDDQFEVSIVVRMAIAHAQFETIHPFIDGNGRVGRLLLPLMLAAEGYPPIYLSGFLKFHQQAYYDALANVQLKEKWTAWVRFFATGVEFAARESIRTAEELLAILNRWHSEVAKLGLRSDSAVNRLPEFLIGNPVVTAKTVEESLGISFPAANNALARLVEIGILALPAKQQRNRIFIAREVVDLLSQPTTTA